MKISSFNTTLQEATNSLGLDHANEAVRKAVKLAVKATRRAKASSTSKTAESATFFAKASSSLRALANRVSKVATSVYQKNASIINPALKIGAVCALAYGAYRIGKFAWAKWEAYKANQQPREDESSYKQDFKSGNNPVVKTTPYLNNDTTQEAPATQTPAEVSLPPAAAPASTPKEQAPIEPKTPKVASTLSGLLWEPTLSQRAITPLAANNDSSLLTQLLLTRAEQPQRPLSLNGPERIIQRYWIVLNFKPNREPVMLSENAQGALTPTLENRVTRQNTRLAIALSPQQVMEICRFFVPNSTHTTRDNHAVLPQQIGRPAGRNNVTFQLPKGFERFLPQSLHSFTLISQTAPRQVELYSSTPDEDKTAQSEPLPVTEQTRELVNGFKRMFFNAHSSIQTQPEVALTFPTWKPHLEQNLHTRPLGPSVELQPIRRTSTSARPSRTELPVQMMLAGTLAVLSRGKRGRFPLI